MSSSAKIVSEGGWITRTVQAKTKAQFFTFLSVLWLVVACFGVITARTWMGELGSMAMWLYLLALVPEPVLAALAIVFWITEEPRSVKRRTRDPAYHLKNLY